MPIISFLHAKGGVGKTTSTMWLAAAAAYSPKVTTAVHIVDADINQGSLTSWHEDAEALHESDSEAATANVTLHSGNYRQVLKALETIPKDEVVIVDGPPADFAMISDVARYSDFVVIPTKGTAVEIEQILTTINRAIPADKKQPGAKKYAVLFTMWNKSSTLVEEARDALEELNEPYFWPPIAKTTYLERAAGTWPADNRKELSGYDFLLNQILEKINA